MSLDRLITRWKTDPTIAANINAWEKSLPDRRF
jgi:hypothetical protein